MAREFGAADIDDEAGSSGGSGGGAAGGGNERQTHVNADTDGQDLQDHDTDGVDIDAEGGDAGDAGGDAGAAAGQQAQQDLGAELLQQAQQFGIQGYQDPRQLIRDLWGYAQQRNQFARELQQMRQEQARWQQQASMAAQQQQQPAQPQQQTKKFWDPPAQISPTLMRTYQEPDPNSPGGWKWKENTPTDLIVKYNALQAYHAEWAGKLATDPEGALAPLLDQFMESRVQKAINEALQQRVSPMQESLQAQAIMQRNIADIAQLDPQTGMPMFQPNGAPVLSPMGQLITHYVGQVARAGVTDYGQQFAMARQMAEAHIYRQQQMQQAQIAAADQAAKRQVHAQTNTNAGQRRISPRRGTNGQKTVTRDMSLFEKMKARAGVAEG